MDVAADDVDNFAQDVGVRLPDIECLGGGDGASIAGSLEGGARGLDEAGQLGGADPSVHDRLVSDNDHIDESPLGPCDDLVNLLLGGAEAGVADEDTEDQLEAVGFGGASDVLEGGAVSAVDTHGLESLLGYLSNVRVDRASVLAASIVVVRGVGHGPVVATRCNGRGCGALGWCRGNRLGRVHGGRNVGRRRGDGRGRAEGADIDVVALGDGGGDGGLGVGAGGVGGRDGVDPDGGLGHGGGQWGDGVGAGRGADVGGSQDGAGDHAARGGGGGIGADDGGRGLNHGGDAAHSVGAGAGDRGGAGAADGGLLGDGDGRGRDGVDAGAGEGRHVGRGHRRCRRGGGSGRGRGRRRREVDWARERVSRRFSFERFPSLSWGQFHPGENVDGPGEMGI